MAPNQPLPHTPSKRAIFQETKLTVRYPGFVQLSPSNQVASSAMSASNSCVIPHKFREYISYNHDHHVFICKPCEIVIKFQRMISHSEGHFVSYASSRGCNKHPTLSVSGDERNLLKEATKHLPGARTDGTGNSPELPQLPNGTLEIHDLPTFPGWQCPHCDHHDGLTPEGKAQETMMRRHLRKKHPDSTLRKSPFRHVILQTLHGKGQGGYFVIKPRPSEITSETTSVLGEATQSGLAEFIRNKELQIDQTNAQAANLQQSDMTERNREEDTSEWLQHIKWPPLFAGKNLQLISETRQLNKVKDEGLAALLPVLHRAFNLVMQWSFETLDVTPRLMRQRMRSYRNPEEDCSRRPLKRLQDHETELRYIRYYKEFITFVFVTAMLSEQERKTKYGIRFSPDQLKQITGIVDEFRKHDYSDAPGTADLSEVDEYDIHEDLDDDDPDDEDPDDLGADYDKDADPDERSSKEGEDDEELSDSVNGAETYGESTPVNVTPLEHLAELLIEFLVGVLVEKNVQIETFENPLYYFTAVLGITNEGRYREVHNYTSISAGILWVNKMLLLEYALSKRGHSISGWESLKSLSPHQRPERLTYVHGNYVKFGSYSVTSRIGEDLGIGIGISRKRKRNANIVWRAADKFSLVGARDFPATCNITEVQKFMSGLSDKVDQLLSELFFGSLPAIDLKKLGNLRDMQDCRNGYWCTEDTAADAFSVMCDIAGRPENVDKECLFERSWDAENGRVEFNWDRENLGKYLRKKKHFLEILMAAVYVWGGFPPRGKEEAGIKFRNTPSTVRNLLVDTDGSVFYQLLYNKTGVVVNNADHIARYVPENIGRALMLYVTYIRPFAHRLYNQLQTLKGKEQQKNSGDYLFCDDGEPTKIWSKRLTPILERESLLMIQIRITMQRWRHIAVGVAKKHFPSRIAFYFDNDEKACIKIRDASKAENVRDHRAKQAGHRLETDIVVYGVDGDYMSSLQPDHLGLFRWVSAEWQTFWTADLGAWSLEMWERSALKANPPLTAIGSSNVNLKRVSEMDPEDQASYGNSEGSRKRQICQINMVAENSNSAEGEPKTAGPLDTPGHHQKEETLEGIVRELEQDLKKIEQELRTIEQEKKIKEGALMTAHKNLIEFYKMGGNRHGVNE